NVTIGEAPLEVKNLSAYYNEDRLAVRDVTMRFANRAVTALMGPSGCGKTTLLRCLNRIHEIAPGARAEGEVLLDGEDVYRNEMSVTELRRRVGMVFQRPNPFPTMSIFGNVASGLSRSTSSSDKTAAVEKALRSAVLWDEVKDKLNKPATALSGGQQQRLCIARALAVEPEVLLMDEPTSSLDPISTLSVEELMTKLAQEYTIIVVTHNMQQAARVSKYAAFMLADESRAGKLIEMDETSKMFTKPSDRRTEDYITGRFG
ncbi:MAG TPA: phosphate ABC transporter ATP-binding protein PstB, partial [Candidatus Baltobacteraceae bacterium]|nr:phosphate ABC transporter ATP-binding protein PstB [Candidatus Baltobacteraceae bacterium]